ncbi:MAG TPA: acyl-CoA dehydrogenase family protein [Mycobacteriales bacterium]|nr:acyl-CoA dehydrogenase family protein [Mycobacteriales bacterium]
MTDEAEIDRRLDQVLAQHPPATATTDEILDALFDAGLAWVHFPPGHGGWDASPDLQERVYRRLLAAGGPDYFMANPLGYAMGGPTVMTYGTEAQKAQHLRAIFKASSVWCQLFSEPSAGSDLANVSTRAVRDGDGWRVTGQKVWTTLGHIAGTAMLLARTDPDAVKHRGLTYFLLDMHAPGVDVRPLRQMTGDAEFNEVFLDDVFVPDSDRLGDVGAGWQVAMTTLSNERFIIGRDQPRGGGHIAVALQAWREREDCTSAEALALRDRLMALYVQADVTWLTTVRATAGREGRDPGPEGSVSKVLNAETNKEVSAFAVELLGPAGMLYGLGDRAGYAHADEADVQATPQYLALRARANSIEGGTTEVMKNILAERWLGLPAEARVDKAQPWSQLPRG